MSKAFTVVFLVAFAEFTKAIESVNIAKSAVVISLRSICRSPLSVTLPDNPEPPPTCVTVPVFVVYPSPFVRSLLFVGIVGLD